MAAFVAKSYQQQVLESLALYLDICQSLGDADTAFYQTTKALWGQGVSYHPLSGFDPAMPYFCLRVPTGGGKTWLAAKSVNLVNQRLLHTEHSVILWLVPSNAIREQTLKALKNPHHPYHHALAEAGPVAIMDIEEAKSVTPATLASHTTVIVCTRQAFQVEEVECRKVYESSGALMGHFDHLTPEQKQNLLTSEDGSTTPYSLANVLRLHRPFVVVDEAHNNRTELGFDTLRRLYPSGILELTATPDTEKTPSNVLHSVWAAELKAEQMIKLPIQLEAEAHWQKCLNHAIAWRNELQGRADAEAKQGARPLRPIVLIQAEPRRKGMETLDVDTIWRELQQNHNIPVEEIARATSEYKELEALSDEYDKGIMDERCPVKYVITQRALAEGWDCPWAYVLVSMAELHSATAVEQLLGRVLRQPDAKHRMDDSLNKSYAFVVSQSFRDTANSLRDSLVNGAGFERREAREFVAAAEPEQAPLDFDRHRERVPFKPIEVPLSGKPNKRELNKLGDKVTWEVKEKRLVINEPLDDADTQTVRAAFKNEQDQDYLDQAAEQSRQQADDAFFHTPAEEGVTFRIPQMGLRQQGELVLFDDPEVLNYPWDISRYDAAPTQEQLQRLGDNSTAEHGEIDTDEHTGQVGVQYLANLTRDLELTYRPEHLDETGLAAWLCRNLPDPSITHASKRAFVSHWLNALLNEHSFTLSRLNARKFFLRDLLSQRMDALREVALRSAYQETLFSDNNDTEVVVGGDELQFDFPPYGYAPNRCYNNRFGPAHFKRHFYGQVGDFDSQEEYECACWLDDQAQKGRIAFWLRNLERKPACAFFLQKATGKFWPDFVCQLPDGSTLVVEYKGGHLYSTDKVKEDRLIGELWADQGGDRTHFVMVKDREWASIEALLPT